jgi:hypothetical protein
LTPHRHAGIRKEKAFSGDQPSAETGFHPGRRHGSLTGPCAAFLIFSVMSFSVSVHHPIQQKKAKNIWTGMFSCPTFLALASTT